MNQFVIKSLVSAIMVFSHSLHGLESESPKTKSPVEVIEGRSEIIVYKDGTSRSFIVSPKLLESSRYLIKIGKEKDETGTISSLNISMADRVQAQKLLFKANQHFIKGQITKTWELVDAAKKLDPSHYRIKTMEGSLLYQMGSKDLAMTRWQQSLKQNPDQPELVAILKENTNKNKGRK